MLSSHSECGTTLVILGSLWAPIYFTWVYTTVTQIKRGVNRLARREHGDFVGGGGGSQMPTRS